jgi:S-adenosylmethionine hydrolase
MKKQYLIYCLLFLLGCGYETPPPAIVLQTDFGQKDGAVAAMKGVMNDVNPHLRIYDLTHEIPAYNVWEAGYRLSQTAPYWPAGTIFVSVVDPGVGTERKSLLLKTKQGQYFISPDNGTLTMIAQQQGIEWVRSIDENKMRRRGSNDSYTFFGRDLYAYFAARFAAGDINIDTIGSEMKTPIQQIAYQQPALENGIIKGNIPILDVQYGNVWTNLPDSLLFKNGFRYGDSLQVEFFQRDKPLWRQTLRLCKTFGDVPEGKPLAYFNSLMNLSFAINMGDFAKVYAIGSGAEWSVVVKSKE